MAVVKNLMIRIGADYSPAKKAMDGATRELTRFRKDTEKTASAIRGEKGLGGIADEFKSLNEELRASISRLRGAQGLGAVTSEVKTLVPLLGRSAAAMSGLGQATMTTGARFGIAGIAVAAFTAALGAATMGIYQASQRAVKFESDLGRLNMQLKGGSREFIEWARAQGLAKTTSVELGATYSTLLSSFISDNKRLAAETKSLVQASRILVSGTGRPIEEVLERVRSGLLGNTEAIEDLGVFVNIAMIESTNAFKKFANGKSWDQLDFRVQQQIRLAAILEQTYARYGNELQNNTMTKQSRLMEQLKDIQLHLSQAFLPIWDAVLPPLIRLAEALAVTTEHLARFMYRLRGLDYDEMTQGTDQQTDAVQNQGDAYADLAKQAAKARKELAAFDELNLIGGGGSGSAGSGGGGGAPGGGIPPSGPGGPGGGGLQLPNIPPLPRLQLQFDPPSPPDAGAGAVATAVSSTINAMSAEVKQRLAELWRDLQAETQVKAPVLQGALAAMFAEILKNTTATTGQIRADWKFMLSGMQGELVVYRPQIETDWVGLKLAIDSMKNPLATVRADWHNTLDYMQVQLNAYRPYLEWGFKLIGLSAIGLVPQLLQVENAWKQTLSNMATSATSFLGDILGGINGVIAAWARMQKTLTGAPAASPANSPSVKTQPATLGQEKSAMVRQQANRAPALNIPTTAGAAAGVNLDVSWMYSPETLAGVQAMLQQEAQKPQNQAAFSIYSTLLPLGKLGQAGKLGMYGDDAVNALKKLWESMKGAGNAIPAFANGGLVYGPTLAMVGDNPGARTDPEVIAPFSDLQDLLDGENAESISVLRQILTALQGGLQVQVSISRDEVGRAATGYINDETRRGRNPIRV